MEIKESLTEYGFNESKLEMIVLFFESQKTYLLDILSSSAFVFPHFKELEWRFETDVSRRIVIWKSISKKFYFLNQKPKLYFTSYYKNINISL